MLFSEKIEGTVVEISKIEDRDIITVIDTEDSKYVVPKSQVPPNVLLKIGNTYSFYKEVRDGRTFLNYIWSGFDIGTVKVFQVKELSQVFNQKYFLLENEYGNDLKVKTLKHQDFNKDVECEVIGYRYGVPQLKNIDYRGHRYKIGDECFFDIIKHSLITDKKGNTFSSVVLKDKDENIISVRSKPWQKKEIWHFDNLQCQVIGYSKDGAPKLSNIDDRHPVYQIGQTIEFTVLGFKERAYKENNMPLKLISLVDEYNCSHEVLLLPNQKDKIKIGDKLSCKLERISYNFHLKQTIKDDPYFFDFNEIIEDKALERKYFTPYIQSYKTEIDILQIKAQYESRSAFYILTFCNRIIPKLFKDAIHRKDYKAAIEINEMLITIESWILKKGIIQALPNEITKKNTKEKVRTAIEQAKIKAAILSSLAFGDVNKLLLKSRISVQELYFIFLFSDIRLLNPMSFIEVVEGSQLNPIVDEDIWIINLFNSVLNYRKKCFLNQPEDEDFLALFVRSDIASNSQIREFNYWTYFQIFLLKQLEDKEQIQLLQAQLIRYSALLQSDEDRRKDLLFAAFGVLQNVTVDDLEIISINEGDISVNDAFLDLVRQNNAEVLWDQLFKDLDKNGYIEVEIKKRGLNGFVVDFKGLNGFLPSNNICDSNLRQYLVSEIDWLTRVEITNYSKEFNYFVVRQLQLEDENYKSENFFKDKPKLYEPVAGIIKSIVPYGVFVATKYGDGLLHSSKITPRLLKENDLNRLFKVNSEIVVQILATEKLSFSYIGLLGTRFKSEYQIFEARLKAYFDDIDSDEIEGEEKMSLGIGTLIEVEKGYVIEQFAAGLSELREKITYIKLAKQFFSNHKNARSYLLNIYIDYFNSLLTLDELISDFSFEKYEVFKSNFIKVRDKINPKTIENFSKTDRLIYFINILILFNETSSNSFNELVSYVQNYSKEDEVLLNTIARITLSNNLMLSVSHRDENFSMRNLRRISDFIKSGIFTLQESEVDRVSRELENKRRYWKATIELDEGANLEFKSSFIKPIPDKKRRAQIAALTKNLSVANDKKAILDKIDEISGLTAQKAIMHSAFKSIAAFTNTTGGFLLLGVSNDKKIYGLEDDYSTFKDISEQSRDGFGKYFDAKLNEYFGDSFSSMLLNKEFLKFPEGDILIIEVKPSIEEVYLLKDDLGNKSEHIYIRNLSSTEKLEGKELARFIREKYRNQINIATNIIK